MPKPVLAELGITSEVLKGTPRHNESNAKVRPFPVTEKKDYFVERNGVRYAGTHLLVEMWGAHDLDDPEAIEQALCDACAASGATKLHVHTHRFSPDGGVSGVIVLAESHISIHTWPEREFCAIDVFMCGDCDPYAAIPVLREAFRPASMQLAEHKRGLCV
jgi:S-adenosylmethionine decarboxylase